MFKENSDFLERELIPMERRDKREWRGGRRRKSASGGRGTAVIEVDLECG